MPFKALLTDTAFFGWELTEEHRGLDFRCPVCDDKFIVVIGTKRVNHFRHRNKNAHSGEAESKEHLEMKKWIYKTCLKNKLKCDLEVIIKDEENPHQTDLVIYFSNKNKKKYKCKGIAIECQCSSISIKEYLERNNTYLDNGYLPWWIIGGNKYKYFEKELDKKIHRIKYLEKNIIKENGFIHVFDGKKFIKVYFTFRDNSRGVLGMYNIEDTNFKKEYELFLNNNRIVDDNIPYDYYNIIRIGKYIKRMNKWETLSEFKKYRKRYLKDRINTLKNEIYRIKNDILLTKNKIKSKTKKIRDDELEAKIEKVFLEWIKNSNQVNKIKAYDFLVYRGMSNVGSVDMIDKLIKQEKIYLFNRIWLAVTS